MRTAIKIVMTLGLTALYGCEMSSRGGGMSRDEGFKIAVPTFDVQVKQGETKEATVSIQRGDNFKRDVTLEFKPTKGISLEPAKALVKASEKTDVHIRITAAKDAAIGEYRVYVKGTPEKGQSTSMDFKVKVVLP